LRAIGKRFPADGAAERSGGTEEDLRRYGFGPERRFEALHAFLDGEPAGFAFFQPRFSTWLGRPEVYP
jgi:hypothetical protein